MKLLMLSLSFFLLLQSSLAQVDFTANDQVIPYTSPFLFGANPGYYDGWDDEGLADIMAGNTQLNLRGAGVETQRLFLPHSFLDEWGYDIRVDEMEYFESLGLKEHTVTIGYPSDAERDPTNFCADHQSELFANMYLPIWLNGSINEENYYANYVYKLATNYKSFIKIYEIWNEPDFDFSGNGFKEEGENGNWFENIPAPCDISIRAPIFHYIRMLRIAYDVIKTVDPDAYVAVGGLGYVSFLDLILRHSDNPDDGKITSEYPLTGGAYFDVMSFHSYPHFDGALRSWNNDINDFEYTRHSDAAVQGVEEKKEEYSELLKSYGYNDNQFPKKVFINTESNLPRVAFDEYIGSDDAQTNFLMKIQVACRKNKIKQYHVYKAGESESEGDMTDAFDAMGFFKNLEAVAPYEQIENECVLASATTTHFLKSKTFEAEFTENMNLSADIGGGYFCDKDDECVIVLWAKTNMDQSEEAEQMFSLPSGIEISSLDRYEWDHLDFPNVKTITPENIPLTGRPSFFIPKFLSGSQEIFTNEIQLYPNQLKAGEYLYWQGNIADEIIFTNSNGQIVDQLAIEKGRNKIQIARELTAGIYFVKYFIGQQQFIQRIVIVE